MQGIFFNTFVLVLLDSPFNTTMVFSGCEYFRASIFSFYGNKSNPKDN